MRIHISLPVTDLAQSDRFYTTLFDQPPSKRREDYLNFRLNQPPIHLALVQTGQRTASAASHYGIELPDRPAFDDWYRRLTGSGIRFEEEPGAKCCYAEGEKLWLTDPDGHRWEVWLRTGDYDRLQQPAAEEEQACCSN